MRIQFALSAMVGGLVIGVLGCLVACGSENDALNSSSATSSPPTLAQNQTIETDRAGSNTKIAASGNSSLPGPSRDTPQKATAIDRQKVSATNNAKSEAKKVSSDPQQSKSIQNRNSQPPVYLRPSYVTRYDVSTLDDLRYAYLLSPLIEGDDPTQWKLLNDAVGELKQFVGNALDASVIAETITTSMPIKGQKAFKQIDDVVNDCVQLLGIDKPAVFIRSDPVPQAYVRGAQKPHILVLTSGLIALYKGAPRNSDSLLGTNWDTSNVNTSR